MIQIRIIIEPKHKLGIDYFPETIYACSRCGELHYFYSIPPSQCKRCKKSVPDLRGLKYNPKAKKEYYMTGTC